MFLQGLFIIIFFKATTTHSLYKKFIASLANAMQNMNRN